MKLNSLIIEDMDASKVLHNLKGILLDYNRPGSTVVEINGEVLYVAQHVKDMVFTDHWGEVISVTRLFTVSPK